MCTHNLEKAKQVAEEYGAQKVFATMEEAFADPAVDIIVNLTRPNEHLEVTCKALEAGKHVYTKNRSALRWRKGKPSLTCPSKKKGFW